MPQWVTAASVEGLFPPVPREPPLPRQGTRCTPAEFRALYQRILSLNVSLTTFGVLAQLMLAAGKMPAINVLAVLSSSAPLGVMWISMRHKAGAQLQDGSARTTPGKAVGFLFIPFFNYYWVFVAYRGLAQDLNAHVRRRELAAPPVSESVALTGCILKVVAGVLGFVPILGALLVIPAVVFDLILLRQIAETSAAIAQGGQTGEPAGKPQAAGGGATAAPGGALALVGAITEGLELAEKMISPAGK